MPVQYSLTLFLDKIPVGESHYPYGKYYSTYVILYSYSFDDVHELLPHVVIHMKFSEYIFYSHCWYEKTTIIQKLSIQCFSKAD